MLDLTSGYQAALDAAELRAKELLEAGDVIAAAGEYSRCAHALRQLSSSSRSQGVREQRLQRAERFDKLAARLKSGLPVSASKNRRGTGYDDASDDEFSDQIRGLIRSANISWDDIAGLEDTKSQIKSLFAIALARKPEGLKIDERPNILLYGPPGTGKTLLAAATSSGLDATFYSVKAGDLLSKYFGESPKLVSKLYEEAHRTAPSVVFIDEIEALTPDRDAPGGVTGPEARILSQFLAEMDGLDTKSSNALVITIAATNKPWLLDDAALSRFTRLIYVELPDQVARRAMFNLASADAGFTFEQSLDELSMMTEGLSGREISAVCREATRRMIERANPSLEAKVDEGAEAVRSYDLAILSVTPEEFQIAISGVRPASNAADLIAYKVWREGQ